MAGTRVGALDHSLHQLSSTGLREHSAPPLLVNHRPLMPFPEQQQVLSPRHSGGSRSEVASSASVYAVVRMDRRSAGGDQEALQGAAVLLDPSN